MGGKHKQAQRTKNNVRPSSSGRSAELLGSAIPSFVGFSAAKDGSYVPVIPGFLTGAAGGEEFDPNIDSSFQLVLKKMSKKDSVTKLKALLEFTQLVNACEAEALKPVLPFWPRFYCALAVDAEHRVREAAHVAQRAVALKAKRNLAPYLKLLAGPWFTSQYDSYAPAASAAQLAFQDAFPPAKLSEVIVFCQEEILKYICDNLTQQTPQSASSAKTNSEEAEAKYQRLLIGSLQGYALYLQKVPLSQIEAAFDANKKIVSNAKFWKLSKHKAAMVRAAWFTTLAAILQRAPTSLLEDEGQRVTTTVLANLDETEPIVLPTVWETALLALFTVQDWWTHINVDKLVLPKLWQVLREAAQGNASSIYPNLLPLISKFPPGSDAHVFYTKFFENIRVGLRQKSVQQSRSELSSVVTSFIECLQYVILKHQSDLPLCEILVEQQLMSSIEWCLVDGHYATKTLYGQITPLVHYWSRNRNNKETPLYAEHLRLFWKRLAEICESVLEKTKETYDKEVNMTILTKLMDLLFSLKRTHCQKQKKQLKVKFSSPDTNADGKDMTDSGTKNISTDMQFMDELHSLVYKTCILFINDVENHTELFLFHLCSLMQEFDSRELFETITFELTDDKNDLISLYNVVFHHWLLDNEGKDTIIDITFVLFKYLDSEQKQVLLTSISDLGHEKAILRSISLGLAHPFRNETVVRNWLQTAVITDLLEVSARKVVHEDQPASPEYMPLLRLACAPDDNGELLISPEALKKIVQIFCQPLLEPELYPTTLDSSARFSSVLSAFLYSDDNATSYDCDLLIALFAINANRMVSSDSLSADTLWEINTAWQDAVTILRSIYPIDSAQLLNLSNKFAAVLQTTILSGQSSDESIDKCVELAMEFICCASPGRTVTDISFMFKIFAKPFRVGPLVRNLAMFSLNGDIITGKLSFHDRPPSLESYFAIFEVDSSVTEDFDLQYMMAYCIFTTKLLTKLFEGKKNKEENVDDITDEDEIYLGLEVLNTEIENEIVQSIFTYAVIQSFSKYYEITTYYDQVSVDLSTFKTALENLCKTLKSEFLETITATILQYARTLGGLWAQTYFWFYHDLVPGTAIDMAEVYLKGIRGEVTKEGWLHLGQMFAGALTCGEINLEKRLPLECLACIRAIPITQHSTVSIMEALAILRTIWTKQEMFFETDITCVPWAKLQFVLEVIRLLTAIINQQSFSLSSVHWDYIFIGLAGWIETLQKSLHDVKHVPTLSLTAAVFDMFTAVAEFMEKIKSDVAAGDGYQKLFQEWTDVVSVDVNIGLMKILNRVLVECDSITILQRACLSISHINLEAVFTTMKWQEILQMCLPLLRATQPAKQLATYMLLKNSLCSYLVNNDTEKVTAEAHNYEKLTIIMFEEVMEETQLVVESMVLEFRLGEESCQVKPHTEAYQYASGYILTWSVILDLITAASSQLRYQYADWIRSHDYLKLLMHNVLRLMPEKVLSTTGNGPSVPNLFEIPPLISLNAARTSEWLEHCACAVYGRAHAVLPALVRQWWSSAESRVSRTIERITATYVSPQLCIKELNGVSSQNTDHLQVKIMHSVREVVATYTVDEARMEIYISLPVNYPLGAVKIECNHQIGASNQSRNAIMQLSLFLTHQNGSVADGLALWKNNLDKHFDGVEECYICFSVIHAGTYQLPKLSCRTCKKKFHSACLYKWFSTSNKSTCPICRNLF